MRKWRRKGTLGALQAWEFEVGEAPTLAALPGEMASLSLAATNVTSQLRCWKVIADSI